MELHAVGQLPLDSLLRQGYSANWLTLGEAIEAIQIRCAPENPLAVPESKPIRVAPTQIAVPTVVAQPIVMAELVRKAPVVRQAAPKRKSASTASHVTAARPGTPQPSGSLPISLDYTAPLDAYEPPKLTVGNRSPAKEDRVIWNWFFGIVAGAGILWLIGCIGLLLAFILFVIGGMLNA